MVSSRVRPRVTSFIWAPPCGVTAPPHLTSHTRPVIGRRHRQPRSYWPGLPWSHLMPATPDLMSIQSPARPTHLNTHPQCPHSQPPSTSVYYRGHGGPRVYGTRPQTLSPQTVSQDQEQTEVLLCRQQGRGPEQRRGDRGPDEPCLPAAGPRPPCSPRSFFRRVRLVQQFL